MILTYVAGLAAILGGMTVLWLVSLRMRDSSIVDIFWSLCFVLAASVYAILTPNGIAERKLLSLMLVTIWGIRLSVHLARRNLGKGEDYRYAKWRTEAGQSWWWRSWLKVFALQGILAWIVSAPLLAVQDSTQPLGVLDVIGAGVWLIGFMFEAIGDWQLVQFKANPANKGKVLSTGLWRFTRHPNYFGDAVVWWGMYMLAVSAGGWWTIFSPLLMNYLLVNISGVAMLESAMRSRKPEYADYIRRTSSFIPWPPAK